MTSIQMKTLISSIKPCQGPSVFIASPYTLGDPAINARIQLDAWNYLFEHGFTPVAPLQAHFQHIAHPRPYEDWIAYALWQLKQCKYCYRIDGESSGADNELANAERWNIKIATSLPQLFQMAGITAPDVFPDFHRAYRDALPKLA